MERFCCIFSQRLFGSQRRVLILLLAASWTLMILWLYSHRYANSDAFNGNTNCLCERSEDALLILITPTHYRLEQLADLTRFSHTLRLIRNLHWIVVEDSENKTSRIENLLLRSTLNYTHLNIKRSADNKTGKIGKGWFQRDRALEYLRSAYASKLHPNAVVYFADDDNSYDLRLFNNYIRHVKTIGVWAVGLVGGALVEAPRVENCTVVGFNVEYAKDRKFALDMAGFAIHLRLILSTQALFEKCSKREPETCFIEQFNVTREQLQPFGYQGKEKEILVWHTKTSSSGKNGSDWGYIV